MYYHQQITELIFDRYLYVLFCAFYLFLSVLHFLTGLPFFLQLVGSLVEHIGSGISYEVSSSLDIMIFLASNSSEELIPISSHITGNILPFVFSTFHLLKGHMNFYMIGILDYLESFHEDNLRKVCDALFISRNLYHNE